MSDSIAPMGDGSGSTPRFSTTDAGVEPSVVPKIEVTPSTRAKVEEVTDVRKPTDRGKPTESPKPAPTVPQGHAGGSVAQDTPRQHSEPEELGVLSQLRAATRRKSRGHGGSQEPTEEKGKKKATETPQPSEETKAALTEPPYKECHSVAPPKDPEPGYSMEILHFPKAMQSHYLDIVVVHDHDETTDSWAYRDAEQVLRKEIDNIKMKVKPKPADPKASNHLSVAETGLGATELESSRASSPARFATGSNWLSDAGMLPKMLPGARVLAFSYPKLRPKEGGQAGYFKRAAAELLSELAKARRSENAHIVVPVVFIGAGFGGLVIQIAIALAAPAAAERAKSTTKENTAEPDKGVSLGLDQVADVIFLDTPFPDGSGHERLKRFFPANSNLRMCAIVQVMEKMEAQWKGLTVEKIWNEFWESLGRLAPETRVTWFYQSQRPANVASVRLPSAALGPISQTITLNPIIQQRLRRLTNFPNSSDKAYTRIVTCLRNHLMFKAAIDSRLKQLQSDLMKGSDIPVNLNTTDERGRTPLHLATMAVNPAGVNLLLGNHADTQARDPSGQTPLHHAIRIFCEGADLEAARQDQVKDVISQLLDYTRKTELHTNRDKSGLSPKDLIHDSREPCSSFPAPCRHAAIRELLESHQPIVRRRSEEQVEDPWRGWGPPHNELARRACTQARAILAEFYESTAGDATETGQLLADLDAPNILDLIYRKEQGPVRILSKLTERHVISKGDVCCRWIHVPANNEQWIHDLFIRLRLRDGSMTGQRHSAHAVYNRYMATQVRRYRQGKFPPAIEVEASPTAPSLAMTAVSEHPPTTDAKAADSTGFLEILKAEGGGWPSVSIPKELSGASEAVVLFMPVLAFENHRGRKVMSRAINRILKPQNTPDVPPLGSPDSATAPDAAGSKKSAKNMNIDTSLIEAYLQSEKPLHCRRTLDQYSYYMLESTESRDMDQVVYKWARNQQDKQKQASIKSAGADLFLNEYGGSEEGSRGIPGVLEANIEVVGADKDRSHKVLRRPKHRPIIMVDQLWLWVLPDGTVITSLPNTADAGEPYNLKRWLEEALFEDSIEAPTQSVDDLVGTIINICVDFFQREGPCGVKFQHCFQYSISAIAEDEVDMYTTYKNMVEFLENLGSAASSSSKLIDGFSQITRETNRLVEIMDIQDELGIVDSILATQKDVLQKLMQHIPKKGRGERKAKPQKTEGPTPAKETTVTQTAALRDSSRIQEAIHIVEDNIRAVAEMIGSAKRVQEDLKQLLDFKQQQSSAWETRFSRKLAEQGQKQNNIMLVFTLVTIVFLPMSFITSFLALGIRDFPKDDNGNTAWPLDRVSGYLFGISIAVSLPLIITAFYVNPISRMVTGKRKQDLRHLKKFSQAEGGDSDSSDSSDDDDSSKNTIKAKKKRRGADDATDASSLTIVDDNDDDDSNYAPLFGKPELTWHTKIPYVRRLWEWKTYRLHELEDLNAGLENLDWDYPLSHWRKKVADPVRLMMVRLGLHRLSEAYGRHEETYQQNRQSDELVRNYLGAKRELRGQEIMAERKQRRARGEARALDATDPQPPMPGLGPKLASSVRGSLMRRGTERRVPDEES
ncbi:hypothetical protein B0H63DRAFT_475184 [Podospora didyma]|uniref:Ankyrin repeat protein n=1 Tax=Podospora didyma TaxID=330526 RepID=A0AAE0NGR3_9PEZI|nr:hypothetical protein B0H63DRAFT_475184 [Podospora didyma]